MSLSLSRPKATIAIPLYNSATTIERCLLSALKQTLTDIEILVVDDASTDAGAMSAETVAGQDDRVRVIRLERNGGKARAMNLMMEQARGVWFAVLDADDAFHPDRLARLIDCAERDGLEMAADNITYIDTGADCAVRTAFPTSLPPRIIMKGDLPANSSSYASFDFGILKPVIRCDFARGHGLQYLPDTKLGEDFYYLMDCLVAGARMYLTSEPMYDWSMPFGAISRKWSQTGSGAWRYDYRNALLANDVYLRRMTARGEREMASMLKTRGRQYACMVHYIDAQKAAAEGRVGDALVAIVAHPSTYSLLITRVVGRAARALRHRLATRQDVGRVAA